MSIRTPYCIHVRPFVRDPLGEHTRWCFRREGDKAFPPFLAVKTRKISRFALFLSSFFSAPLPLYVHASPFDTCVPPYERRRRFFFSVVILLSRYSCARTQPRCILKEDFPWWKEQGFGAFLSKIYENEAVHKRLRETAHCYTNGWYLVYKSFRVSLYIIKWDIRYTFVSQLYKLIMHKYVYCFHYVYCSFHVTRFLIHPPGKLQIIVLYDAVSGTEINFPLLHGPSIMLVRVCVRTLNVNVSRFAW